MAKKTDKHPLDESASASDRAAKTILVAAAQGIFFAPSLAASGLTKYAKSDQEIKQFFNDMPNPVWDEMALKVLRYACGLVLDYAQTTGNLPPSKDRN